MSDFIQGEYELFHRWAKLAKELGLKKLKHGAIEFEFWDRPTPPPVVTEAGPAPLMGEEMPADDQMLFYSTPEFDAIEQALKDAQKPETEP